MTVNEISYEWLKLVEKALSKIEQLPLLEENFPFPWAEASQAMGTALQIPDFQLSSTRTAWKNPSDLLQDMGEKPVLAAIEIAPIAGTLFFALSQRDMVELTSQALTSSEHKEGFASAKLKEGFYYFLLLQILAALDPLEIFKNVSLRLSSASTLPQENGLCIDLQAILPTKSIQGRIICPQTFLSAFKAHQPFQKGTLLSSENIDISLRCEVGYAELSSEEWEKIQIGDFVILDRCSYYPAIEKGSVTLLLGKTPLLLARMKSEGMKILDFALYQEEIVSEEAASSNFILTAEVGHIRLGLQKLLHLQPGALLDLSLRPEQGIDLTIGGKKVGQGELLKLGDTLGIRILDISR